jgi:CheY-like chemotaxis protein
LLADDSITIQKVVDLTFADEGMQVITVGSGAKAIEKLEEVCPDIVLVDIHMPGMSGYEVCEHIKRDERFRHIPVMLLVGSFEPFDEAEARRVGADEYLTKPFQSIRQLINKVGALLGRDAAEEEATTRELTLPSALTPPASEMSPEDLERSTANTAPLQHPLHDAARAERQQEHKTEGGARREASLQDIVQEDEMTQSATPEEFSSAADENVNEQVQATASPVSADFTEARMETLHEAHTYEPETLNARPAPEKSAVVMAAASGSSASMMGARMAKAPALSDDTLLELDDVLPSRRVEEADDFILDLQDEAFTMDAGTLEEYQQELKEAAPEAGEYVEAQLAGEEQRADFALVEEQQMQAAPPQPEPVLIAPQAASTHETTDTAQVAPPPQGQITLSQLSPEVIDAIARRAVEQISERVVEEIAWEVVPQLAELLIKRHLEREKAERP